MTNNTPYFSGRKDYDSEFCGSIPLNFINLIQAHGVLLVLQRDSFTVVQASENAEQLLGSTAAALVQQPLQSFINQEQLQALQEQLNRRENGNYVPFTLNWQSPAGIKALSATLHTRDLYLLLELEVAQQTSGLSFVATYQAISYIISSLKEAESVTAVSNVAANELKKLSGFDRVMVYQFDEAWNGAVVAEAQEEHMEESYLGLHFPASDVPKQARELYTKTSFRIIPDVNAPAAKLYPVINPLTSSLTDISDAILRAVPLVHIEYLMNMGVTASMSTPIIVNNKLWGLISCHHRSAMPVSFELRTSFEIISEIIASQVSAREKETSFRYRSTLHEIELKLMEQVYTSKSLSEGLLDNPSYLLDLLDVQGLVLTFNNAYLTAGEVPDERMVRNLIKWLVRYSKNKIFTTDSLPALFEEAQVYRDVASGLIAIQITGSRNYLLGFRAEVIKSVNWGGNPNEAIKFEAKSKRYHPRNSFNLWREQVEFTSAPWRPEVIEVAQHVRTAMLEKLLKEEEML
ncbi:Phytochrome central region domain-containing protein [Flammeovirgaceae bacterium 311]|nr:Phytochrome central region domain-containing protein [Flammeovirgaceae bacterium 311]